VQVPPTACKSGTATVGVAGVPGATYAWTVDGGTITGDATGDRIIINLGTNTTAMASVTVTAGGCTSRGSGVITLHDPFVVRATIPAAHAGQPLTILWAYENGFPARQTISGSDFGPIAVSPDARNYIYTPATSGNKQLVIDAAMLTSLAAVPAISRQRAVAKSPASASACAAVHTTTSYAVSACVEPPVVLDAPASVITGASFDLSVDRQPGAVALWTIVSGTPSTATGESVTITAGSSGNVDVRVQLTRGACTGQLDRSIAITPKPPCTNPKASVSAGPVGCGSAIVNASFTGTPPFHGFWSDGVPFTTSKMAMARTVTMTGNFSIVDFQDATCAGTSSGVAVLPALGPTATVVAKPNSCVGVDNLTVLFTGKPPFSGIWFNNTTFSTNEMQMVWPAALDLNELMDGRDGTGCRFMLFGGVSQGHETPGSGSV
jgi:hypothetical protein